MTGFLLPGITRQAFFNEYWRQRPLLIRGGASSILSWTVEAGELDELAARVARQAPHLVRRDASTLFVEHVDRASARLAAVAGQCAAALGCEQVWFDAVVTSEPSGIGCHYDASDNFVLQQSGSKRWRLGDPGTVPAEELQHRMLGAPNVGPIFFNTPTLECVLDPGDLLYIPLFWPHWGTSTGPSVSISLVCDARNALDIVLPHLVEHLRRDRRWWAPLPTAGERSRRDAIRAALIALDDTALHRAVEASVMSGQSPKARIDRDQEADEIRPEISIDIGPLRPLFLDRPQPPDLASAVLPTRNTGPNATLNRLLALARIRRLLLVCRAVHDLVGERQAPTVRTLVPLLPQLSPDVLMRVVRRPEVSSWIAHAEERVASRYAPAVEPLVSHLSAFLLPWLLDAGLIPRTPVLLARSTPDQLQLLPPPATLRFPTELPELLEAEPCDSDLLLRNTTGEVLYRVPISLDSDALARIGVRIEVLPTTADGGPVLIRSSDWYRSFFPRTSGSGPLLDLPAKRFDEFVYCMREGTDLVRRFWPEAWEELVSNVSTLLPLASRGLHPNNGTAVAFRGLITSSARPSYLAAQTLVHETGHNKFNTILELFTLLENDPEELYYSPFVDDLRPMKNLLHGVFAFLQDLHVSLRMVGRVPEVGGLSIERYIGTVRRRIEEALATIELQARLTPPGNRLVQGFREALAAGRPW